MNRELIKEIYLSFFFLGRSPVAPGTFGTLGGLVLAFSIGNYFEENTGYILLVLIPVVLLWLYWHLGLKKNTEAILGYMF